MPVTFLINEDRKVVCRTLGEAKLFWHTAGLFVNESEFPQGVEHFGIATVEAMRAGCVPIVIDCGGQREIVEDGRSGFLCGGLAGLVQKSVALVREDGRRCTMSEQAVRRSMKFAGDTFDRRLVEIVEERLGSKEKLI
jgi:glycosyltransferase involved in cell wall biosynthesis